jgi:hypothetical protein
MSTFTYTVLNCRNYSDLYKYVNKYISDTNLSITNNYNGDDAEINLIFSYSLTFEQIQLLNSIMLSYVPNNTVVTFTLNKSIFIANTQISSVAIWSTVAAYYFVPVLDSALYNIVITSYTNNSSYKIRLYDISNNNVLLVSNILTNNTSEPIILNTLTNLPNNNSIIELQVFQNTSNSIIYINSCNFLYANVDNL